MSGARPEWVTTTVLLRRLSDFRDDAWQEFAQRFQRPIVQFARRGGLTDAESEDVAQDTLMAFAQAYQRGRYERSQGRLRTWLFGIARRKVADTMRERYRRRDKLDSAGGHTSFWEDVADPDAQQRSWDEAWEEEVLRESLRRVRREVRDTTYRAFEMVALEQVPGDEVARRLNLTRNAVFIAKHRVLRRLREMGEEFEHQQLPV